LTAAERIATVERWVVRQLGSCRHERQVVGIATRLFDLTARLHGLPPFCRRFLRIGALVHDVGRIGGAAGHHVRGARMVVRNHALPLSAEERQAAAFLTRFHRKRPPTKRNIREWTDNNAQVGVLRKLLAIFRAADALDSRRLTAQGLTMRLDGRRLRVRCFVDGDRAAAGRAFDKKRKFQMLQEVLGLSVKVQIRGY
jgi:exopolyphosphatase/pppGpp-phosphohydrolase